MGAIGVIGPTPPELRPHCAIGGLHRRCCGKVVGIEYAKQTHEYFINRLRQNGRGDAFGLAGAGWPESGAA